MEYLKHPKTVKDLAAEIKKLSDAYWGREITEKELKEAFVYYGLNENKKLFKASEINPTIKLIIGKQRTDLLEKLLEGLQSRIL